MRNFSKNSSGAAQQAIQMRIVAGASVYRRECHLPRLLPFLPGELTGPEPQTSRLILLRLARALRQERQRGRSGHWTYDLNRHLGLAQAYRAEREKMREAGASRRGTTQDS